MDQVVKFFEDQILPAEIEIKINAKPNMKFMKARPKGKKKIKLPIFSGDDSIGGVIDIKLKEDDQYEHMGVKCTLIGALQLYEQPQLSTEFHSLSKQLQPAGKIRKKASFKFNFPTFEKQYQTYYGVAGQVHYFIRVTLISNNYLPNVNKEISFAVVKLEETVIQKIQNKSLINMEVGVSDQLSLTFEYEKDCFHLKDCVIGRVIFKEIKMNIKTMQLWLIRYQVYGKGKINEKDKQVLIKYELMDDCPESGDVIPIRMFLNGVPKLTPSYINIHNRMSVKYALSLVVLDKKNKKYYKQADIILYRKI